MAIRVSPHLTSSPQTVLLFTHRARMQYILGCHLQCQLRILLYRRKAVILDFDVIYPQSQSKKSLETGFAPIALLPNPLFFPVYHVKICYHIFCWFFKKSIRSSHKYEIKMWNMKNSSTLSHYYILLQFLLESKIWVGK